MDIVTRAEWGARYGRGNPLDGPLGEVVIHTSAGRVGVQPATDEVLHWRGIERYHVEVNGWTGIGYSFGIFPSGRIYEGRGWLRSGAHTEGRNYVSHGMCFIGHGDYDPATPAQWDSMRWLIGEGIRVGAVRRDPRISGHRDYSTKSCPGDLIYPHLGRLRGITGPITEGLSMAEAQDILDAIARLRQDATVFGTTGFEQTMEDIATRQRDTLAKLDALDGRLDSQQRQIDALAVAYDKLAALFGTGDASGDGPISDELAEWLVTQLVESGKAMAATALHAAANTLAEPTEPAPEPEPEVGP